MIACVIGGRNYYHKHQLAKVRLRTFYDLIIDFLHTTNKYETKKDTNVLIKSQWKKPVLIMARNKLR